MTSAPLLSALSLDSISLVVRHADRVVRFYTDVLGMHHLSSKGSVHLLGFGSDDPVLELIEDETSMSRPGRAPGLFHVAFLYPTRAKLAAALHRLVSSGWALQGAADHGVSEAIYLADPEGNGIELYADRPKEEWPYHDGQLSMVTEHLDLEGLLAQATKAKTDTSGTVIGHVHLQVSSLQGADAFWVDGLGLEATQRSFPGALFASAAGYHHHLGLNTWRSKGASLPEGLWTGLRSMSITVPDSGEFSGIISRLEGEYEEDRQVLTTRFESTILHIHHS